MHLGDTVEMDASTNPEDRIERWIDLTSRAATGVIVPLVRDALVPVLRVAVWGLSAYLAVRHALSSVL